MRTSRVAAVAAALGLAGVIALTGCGGDGGSSSAASDTVPTLDPNQDVTITMWHGQTSEAAKILAELAAEYEQEHPNVTIETASGASTTDELLQKISAGFASDSYPDISYAYGSWATELGLSGKTLDITDKTEDPALDWTDFPEASRKTATVDGKTIGLPAVVGNLGLVYNKELFDAADLEYPDEDWTWDDFRAAAKALTDPENKIYGTAYPVNGSEDTTWRFWPQLWQNGGDILSEDQSEAVFNSQAGVDALTFWQEMAQEDQSVYLDQNGERYGALFNSGAIGMMITGPWVLYDLQQQDLDYGVTYLPGTDGDHQTISGSDLWVMFNHDDPQRAAAAYDFTQWLTQPEQDARWNVALGNLPLRLSEGSTKAFQQYVEDYPGADVFFSNLQNAKNPRPTVEGYVGLSRAIGTAIDNVLLGGADAQEQLDKAKEQADVELAG
jgi:multiple sugar transport system substrate-binding protein